MRPFLQFNAILHRSDKSTCQSLLPNASVSNESAVRVLFTRKNVSYSSPTLYAYQLLGIQA